MQSANDALIGPVLRDSSHTVYYDVLAYILHFVCDGGFRKARGKHADDTVPKRHF